MDKTTKIDSIAKQPKAHSITIEERNKISMSGVEKVVSSGENMLSLLTSGGGLTVVGKNLKINMFNIADGSFSAEGEIDAIKYSSPKAPLLKRMFK